MSSDDYFMGEALREAKKGMWRTSPNPCVGAVIVKNGIAISRGYHKKAGTPHAEVHALAGAGENAKGATIYVTLEPCSHTGRTPPCCEALVKAGLARVVVGMTDPNPLVDGNGVKYLRKHGIEVVTGILENKCRAINEPFIKYMATGKPLVVLKAGLSLDGKITYQHGKSGWMTGDETSRVVHRMRDRFDAILIGSSTARIDDPSLTTRLSHGKGRDPLRVVLDSSLSLPPTAKMLTLESRAQTMIFTAVDVDKKKIEILQDAGAVVYTVGKKRGRLDFEQILKKLGAKGITSLLVEGGAEIHGSLLNGRHADRVCLFYAPLFAGDSGVSVISGVSSTCRKDAISLTDVEYKKAGNDLMIQGKIHYPE